MNQQSHLLGIYPEKNHNTKRHMLPNVHCSPIYNSLDTEATQTSLDRRVDKEDVVHIHNGRLLSHKRDEFESIIVR